MSADNYWLVRKKDGKYVLSMEFMSDDEVTPMENSAVRREFTSLAEVHAAMGKEVEYDWGHGSIYTEYGIVYDFPTRTVEQDYLDQLHKLAADAIDLAANLTYWTHSNDDAILALRARKIKLEENHEA